MNGCLKQKRGKEVNRWDRKMQFTLSIRTPDRKHLSIFQSSFQVMYKKESLVKILQIKGA